MSHPRLLPFAVLAICLLFTPHRANAQILLNGGFELPAQTSGSINPVTPTDWNDSVDSLVSNGTGIFGNTPYGSQFVIMTGGEALSQTISGFTQGETYVLGFDFAYEGLTESDPLVVSISGAANVSASFTLTGDGAYASSEIPFQSGVVEFTATSSGLGTISFSDLGAAVAVDNVGLYGNIKAPSSPEPSTYAEMLLGLVALVGFGLMRRRSARA